MNKIPLKGLVARHPGAALAAFGMYGLIKGCALKWVQDGVEYYPLLMTPDDSEIRNDNDLVRLLCDGEAWRKRLWREDPCDTVYSNAISLKRYVEYSRRDEWASVLATDQKITVKNMNVMVLGEGVKPKKEKSKMNAVALTPFCMFLRQMSWGKLSNTWICDLDRRQVLDVLTRRPWTNDCYSEGSQTNGLFYEITYTSVNTSFGDRTIPVVGLLACLAYPLFPCFTSGGRVTALGWDKGGFSYPIFSRATKEESFFSWVCGMKQLAKMSRDSMSRLGLLAIYRSNCVSYKMSGSNQRVLGESVLVK